MDYIAYFRPALATPQHERKREEDTLQWAETFASYYSYCVILYVPRDFIAPFTLACATAVILVATPMKKS